MQEYVSANDSAAPRSLPRPFFKILCRTGYKMISLRWIRYPTPPPGGTFMHMSKLVTEHGLLQMAVEQAWIHDSARGLELPETPTNVVPSPDS